MEELAKKLNITDPSAWYSVKLDVFYQYGGSGVLRKYNGSKRRLLQAIFPEYLQSFLATSLSQTPMETEQIETTRILE